MSPMKFFCSTMLALCTFSTAVACTLPTYHASYHFTGVAHGTVTATLTGSAGHYTFSSITHAQKLWFHQTLSTQTAGQVLTWQLQPQQVNDTTTPLQWIFTTQQLQVRQGATVLQTLALTTPTVDANSLPLQLQLDLTHNPNATAYPLTAALANTEHQVTILPLTFTRQASTTLTLQAQTLTVNNLQAEYRLNGHTIQTTYGFAPAWHSVLVQSQTTIDGKPIATATLRTLQWTGGCV